MYLDTRDLKELLVELEEAELAYTEAKNNLSNYDGDDEDKYEDLQEDLEDAERNFSEEEEKKLHELRELRDQIGGEWEYGETLIPEDMFPEYVEDLCKDCGYINRDFPHWIVIDWEKTSKNVAIDYQLVEYDGENFYVRA